MQRAQFPLKVVIVGGGVGGLTASIFLAQDGHHVTILERRGSSWNSQIGGGVALFENSISCFRERGLWDKISEVTDSSQEPHILSYKGDTLARTKKAHAYAMVKREDLLRVLAELAVQNGVDIKLKSIIASIQDSEPQPSLELDDGSRIEANLIIGADGINSFVRQQIFPQVEPRLTPAAVMLVEVPQSVMQSDEKTMQLWKDTPYRLYLGPGRSLVCWTVTRHKPPLYHLQMCDHQYKDGLVYTDLPDPANGAYVETITDNEGLKRRWYDFGPAIQHIVDSVDSYIKWKIAEIPPLSTWSTSSGRVVLLGDAAHAVKPFAGQGANMAFEDAACLATLLSSIESLDQLRDAMQVYDNLRIPRLAGLREIIEINVETYSMDDGQAQEKRDAILTNSAKVNDGRSYWRSRGREEMFDWLEEYKTVEETAKAWSKFKQDSSRSEATLTS